MNAAIKRGIPPLRRKQYVSPRNHEENRNWSDHPHQLHTALSPFSRTLRM